MKSDKTDRQKKRRALTDEIKVISGTADWDNDS